MNKLLLYKIPHLFLVYTFITMPQSGNFASFDKCVDNIFHRCLVLRSSCSTALNCESTVILNTLLLPFIIPIDDKINGNIKSIGQLAENISRRLNAFVLVSLKLR